MKAYRARFPIRVMCRVLGLSRERVLRLVETPALEAGTPGRGASGKRSCGSGTRTGESTAGLVCMPS